jgi:predicted MFS family arabinose efflux permease
MAFLKGASQMALSIQSTLKARIKGMSRELKLFASASFVMGVAYSLFDSMFNNFLNDRFSLTGFQRSLLELPRELPGLLVVFVTASLWFLCSRRLGVIAMLLGVAGTLLIGFVSSTFTILVFCLFVYSLGQHLFMPAASTIGMELAKEGKTGQRLGQLNAIRNFANIVGSFIVFLGFKFLGLNYHNTFVMAALLFGVAAIIMFNMKPQKTHHSHLFLKLHKEYRLFYILSILYGSRKQLFITFAPWVIVTIFNKPTATTATLITIGGIIGIFFQPLLGWAIDHLGERFVLILEAILLAIICLGYGFVREIFPDGVAFLFVCVFYLLDQMLMSVNMARAMYMKKIAIRPEDIQPALTVSVTLDHAFSISIALIGGLIWSKFGYQYVFLLGVFIALANLVAATKIRIPSPGTKPS